MSLLKQYDSFLLDNASQITAVESTLRSITYFLPGRFKDAELASEAIFSGLNLLGLYHDSILVRAINDKNGCSPSAKPTTIQNASAAAAGPSNSSPFTPSEHARYTQHFAQKSSTYSYLARALVIVGYLELLVEMMARRKLGKKRAWNVVASIEAVKALLRISLIHLTNGRMSIQPPIPEREVDPAMLEEERSKSVGSFAHAIDSAETSAVTRDPPKGYWKGARTGFLRPTLASLHPDSEETQSLLDPKLKQKPTPSQERKPPHLRALRLGTQNSGSDSDDTLVDSSRLHGSTSLNSSQTLALNGTAVSTASPGLSSPTTIEPWTERQINDYLLTRVVSVNEIRKPEDLVRPLKGSLGKTAEMMWVLRPLIYVLAIRKWGRKHTAPFLLSFCIEYLAKNLGSRSRSSSSSSLSISNRSLFGNPLVTALTGGNPILGLLASAIGPASSDEKQKKPISQVEQAEWSKRDRSFWWYLLRGPVWYNITRPKLSSLIKRTENKALIGMVSGIVGDYLPLIDEYYFYSAT